MISHFILIVFVLVTTFLMSLMMIFMMMRRLRRSREHMSYQTIRYGMFGGAGHIERYGSDYMDSCSMKETINNVISRKERKKWSEKHLWAEKHVILFLGSNCEGQAVIPLEADCASIREVLAGSKVFHVVSRKTVQKQDIIPLITKFHPSIIHFDAHGTENGEIRLGGKLGDVNATDLNWLYNEVNHELKFVYYDVCSSAALAENSVLSIDASIGMDGLWPVTCAPVFAREFYLALEKEYSVQKAYNLAKAQLNMCHASCVNMPKLYLARNVNGDNVYFTLKRKGNPDDKAAL